MPQWTLLHYAVKYVAINKLFVPPHNSTSTPRLRLRKLLNDAMRWRESFIHEWRSMQRGVLLTVPVSKSSDTLTVCHDNSVVWSTRVVLKQIKQWLINLTKHTHIHTQLFNGPLPRTTQVSRYQKKHSPTHTHEKEGYAQTRDLIPFTLLWASEGC